MVKNKLSNQVIFHLIDDQLQMIEKEICGIYQIYFNVNLFNSLDKSSTFSEINLSKRTIEKLLKQILSIDRSGNESRIKAFAQENTISQK